MLKLQPWRWIVLAACAIVLVGVLYRGHQVSEGQEAFERLGCSTCHSAGGGPSLEHVARKMTAPPLLLLSPIRRRFIRAWDASRSTPDTRPCRLRKPRTAT